MGQHHIVARRKCVRGMFLIPRAKHRRGHARALRRPLPLGLGRKHLRQTPVWRPSSAEQLTAWQLDVRGDRCGVGIAHDGPAPFILAQAHTARRLHELRAVKGAASSTEAPPSSHLASPRSSTAGEATCGRRPRRYPRGCRKPQRDRYPARPASPVNSAGAESS